MVNTVISGATATTPRSTDKVPLARPGDTTPYNGTAAGIAALGPAIANGLVATGTGQGTALLLTAGVNVVTSCASPTAVILPGGAAVTIGLMLVVNDDVANNLTMFPPVGGLFTTKSLNASVIIPIGGAVWCIWKTGLNWSLR